MRNTYLVRNGHFPTAIPHYKCKDCGKAFSSTTNMIFQNTHMPRSTWKKYREYMVVGMSIRKTAEVYDLNKDIVFYYGWEERIFRSNPKIL